MNGLRHKILNLCLLIAAGGSISIAIGGEKIVLSDDKPKSEPTPAAKRGEDLFKSWSKVEQPGFDYNVLGLPMIPRNTSLDKEELKRLKNINDERKNWLMLEPGELQRKEADKKSLGVANRPLENISNGKDEQPTDYTFYGVGEKPGAQRRQPGELQPLRQGTSKEESDPRLAQQQQREQDDADADSRREKVFTLNGGSKETQFGSHTATELNFNTLFAPSRNDALIMGGALKSESAFSLKEALGNQPARTKDQQARMDDFNKMMSAPLAGGASFGVASPPSSFSQPATPPGMPRLDDAATRPPVNPLFNPNVSSAPAPNRFLPPGLPTFNGSPGYVGASPFQSPVPPDSPRNWSRPPQELPRRKF
jgi:hypothetical protein